MSSINHFEQLSTIDETPVAIQDSLPASSLPSVSPEKEGWTKATTKKSKAKKEKKEKKSKKAEEPELEKTEAEEQSENSTLRVFPDVPQELPSIESLLEKVQNALMEYYNSGNPKVREAVTGALRVATETGKKAGEIFDQFVKLIESLPSLSNKEKIKNLKKMRSFAVKYRKITSDYHNTHPEFLASIESCISSIELVNTGVKAEIDAEEELFKKMPDYLLAQFLGLKKEKENPMKKSWGDSMEDEELEEFPTINSYVRAANKGRSASPEKIHPKPKDVTKLILGPTPQDLAKKHTVSFMVGEARGISARICDDSTPEDTREGVFEFALRQLVINRYWMFKNKPKVCTMKVGGDGETCGKWNLHSYMYCEHAKCSGCKKTGRLYMGCPCNETGMKNITAAFERPCAFCGCDNHTSEQHKFNNSIIGADDAWE